MARARRRSSGSAGTTGRAREGCRVRPGRAGRRSDGGRPAAVLAAAQIRDRACEARPRPADLLSGAAVLVRDRPLRPVTWASGVGQLGVGALPVVSVLLARRYDDPWATSGPMTAFAWRKRSPSGRAGRRSCG
uniref:Uncharacterized protein n=1 Tax=Streptomyces sp. KIB-H033 TaxID=1912612 RepID=A0A1I9S3P7_9ACTN|nr:hypothetical protein [Streptomyces sp. KIB-H033]